MTIGLIGTGLMGLPMVQRLLEAQYEVMVYNRTVEKLTPLKDTKAQIGESAIAVLAHCEVVILMLTDAPTIREVVLTEEGRSRLAHRTILQMGTIAPDESRSLHKDIESLGGAYLEAPVLGSIAEVKAGKLMVMVGATPEQFQRWSPLFHCFGPEPLHIGAVGSASALKLALNQLISSLTAAFALSLNFVQQQGVGVEPFMQILRQSALYAPTFDKKLQRMVEGNYEHPNFPTKHLLKDTKLFLSAAGAIGMQTDNLDGVCVLLEKACAMGLANADYSALFEAVKQG